MIGKIRSTSLSYNHACCVYGDLMDIEILCQIDYWFYHVFVGVRSMENKKILPHAHKQAKIYLLDCSNESIEALTLEDSKAVNEGRLSWVM